VKFSVTSLIFFFFFFCTQKTQVPEEFTKAGIPVKFDGTHYPWADWDFSLPTSHHIIYFSSHEVENMHNEVEEGINKEGKREGAKISHLDTLIAHIWTLITRARGVDNEDGTVNLTYAVGVRNRLSPALPSSFVGSPLLIASVVQRGREATEIKHTAEAIRNVLAKFTPPALGAHFHDLAYETSPQRFWVSSFGKRGCIFTSWLRLDPFFSFFENTPLRYVEPVMPKVDGCLQVMEAMAVSYFYLPSLPLFLFFSSPFH
jgi:hypothetical protein